MTFSGEQTATSPDFWSLVERLRDVASVRQVVGDPVERGGVTLIPVAAIRTGLGGGSGSGTQAEGAGVGGGGGGGVVARPVGAFVVQDGKVTWQPAVDVSRAIFGAQVVAGIGVLVLGRVLRRVRRRRR